MTELEIIKGDITQLKVDAIVNAANKTLLGGGGVDGAIHRAAGKQLLEECQTLGGCETGEAKTTKGYKLPAKYIIHTVGPVWYGGKYNELEKLKSCYKNSLKEARKIRAKTIAFPAISCGVYRMPIDKGAAVAINTVKNYIKEYDKFEKIIFIDIRDVIIDKYKEIINMYTILNN